MNRTKGRYAARKPRNPFYLLAALAVGMLLLVGACASAEADDTPRSAGTPDRTEIQQATLDCPDPYIEAGDDGHTLLIDHQGEDETYGASIDNVVCALAALGISDSVVAQMDSTRALDGTRSGSWDGYTATFSYHPDTGLNIIVEEG